MRSWLWLIGGAVLVGGGGVAWWLRQAPEEVGPTYDSARVDRGDIASRITATGTLSALVTVQVGSQVSGRIQALHADFNDKVEQGQVLARLDPQLFEAALSQARANHAVAKANVAQAVVQAKDAERQAQRSRSLAERKLIAPADAETAETTAEVARAKVEAAQASLLQTAASLEQAQINLSYATIHSPISGVVISRNVDVGQTVAASLQAPVLFEIAEDLRRMQVDTSVAEADVGALRPGMKATFTVDAYPQKDFVGTVRQIRNAATMVQNVVTYDAVIDVANDGLELKPGMTANVTFEVARRQDALRIPNAALRFRPAGATAGPQEDGRRAVYVLRDGRPARVPVELGISDGRFTEVVQGDLHEGDEVVLEESSGGARPTTGGNRRRPPGFL
ncbi:MAG: efflux RND transporter periplasmic adaptor subunit [Deltaproteobacteria bacterium]|nr:efflux RND transporter periplasmic adaptor subunit [Deltaproteobacteria bacterium]